MLRFHLQSMDVKTLLAAVRPFAILPVLTAAVLAFTGPLAMAQDATYSASDVVKHFGAAKTRSLQVEPAAPRTRALCIGTRDECAKKAQGEAAPAAPTPMPPPEFNMLVSFEYDSARLSEPAKANLREFAKGINMPELASARFSIEGHTDDVGSATYNQDLSEKRAIAVKQFLADQGVDPSRLEATGFGESRPKVPNGNDSANRRVESRMMSRQ